MHRRVTSQSLPIQWAGHELLIFRERAVYWPAQRSLLVSDLHLGKTATFRAQGIPVPEGGTETDLARLRHLLEWTGADTLTILGDFFHGPLANSFSVRESFQRWREALASLRIELIPGNHDRKCRDLPAPWGITLLPAVVERAGCWLSHQLLAEPKRRPNIYGHLHPVWRAIDKSSGYTCKLACFVLSQDTLLLPAFGTFTGGKPVNTAHQQIYACTENSLLAV